MTRSHFGPQRPVVVVAMLFLGLGMACLIPPAAVSAEDPFSRGEDLITNPGFEGSGGWEYRLWRGAEGSAIQDRAVVRTGHQSLRITKSNGRGWVDVVSTAPVHVKAGQE